MNEPEQHQYQIDFLTGFSTAITDDSTSWRIRSACTAINKQRARGIQEAAKFTAPSEPVSLDVWSASFEQQARQWEVPLVPLSKLGITFDKDGYPSSSLMQPLRTGAEAAPYLDADSKVVYKLFDLRTNGSLGKKIILNRDSEGSYNIEHRDANLVDTMEKLSVLNEAGGHITEIVGLAEGGDFLIAKQPQAYAYDDLKVDRDIAVQNIRGIVPLGPSVGHVIAITWIQDNPWMIGDLHEGNIMRDVHGEPVIIDALTGTLPPLAHREVPGMAIAIQDAIDYRKTNQIPLRKPFDDVDNDDL